MTKKEKILFTALDLFNKNGSDHISTNHIAKAAEISPGNLYYHFSNKKEIIRNLLEIMIKEYDMIFDIDINNENKDNIIEQLLFDDTELIVKYRFFYNEIHMLFAEDEVLKKMYIENQEKKEKILFDILKHLQDADIIDKKLSDRTMHNIINFVWNFENFRIFRLELQGKEVHSPEDFDKEEIKLERIISVYGFLTEKGKAHFVDKDYF